MTFNLMPSVNENEGEVMQVTPTHVFCTTQDSVFSVTSFVRRLQAQTSKFVVLKDRISKSAKMMQLQTVHCS